MSDQRGHLRLPIKINVDFTSDDSVRSVFSLNMGAGGIYLVTHKPLPRGSMVVLHLNLPSLDSAVEVLGEVVWSNLNPDDNNGLPEGMGIRFLNLDALVKEHIGLFQSARMGNA
ncbi:MAG: TIGR02266 family protein [Deltaproteobacteria bacterium]|nr:TIGR02266 family protein [Deltaproteobacteria bacterium]